MKAYLAISIALAFNGGLMAQLPGLTTPPSGNNQRATVTQAIGPVQVTIEYSSPAVHAPDGTDRRGALWGKLVPYEMTNLGFSDRLSPWRAGANENTVFAASHDVTIEGKRLPAGRYGLHMLAGPEQFTLIFSKNSIAWGSFQYDEADDVLRVTVKPHKHEYREWLTYEFTTRKPTMAVAEMQWEELAVPWTIEVKDANDIYISRHSCPKQSLSSGFPQSNPLICSGVGSHQKTRSTTACAYPVQDTDRRGDGGRGTEGAQTWRCTGFPWLSTRAEVAPTGHSLSKTRLAKSCFGQD
jgi:hypothetical protein